MINNIVSQSEHFRSADVFFILADDVKTTVFLLLDIPLVGKTQEEINNSCVELLERVFRTDEWLVGFNRRLPVYINGIHYPDFFQSSNCLSNKIDNSEIANTYTFDVIITDMPEEYSKVEMVTKKTIEAVSHIEATTKAKEWIEKEYSNFKELEWYIVDEGEMQLNVFTFRDFLKYIKSGKHHLCPVIRKKLIEYIESKNIAL